MNEATDEIGLALRADAWGRGLRAKVVTTGAEDAPVHTRRGLIILPDAKPADNGRYILPFADAPAGAQLKLTLDEMTRRYGAHAARLAILGLEADPTDMQ